MDTAPDTAARLAKPHRKAVLTALLWLTVIAGTVFACLNIAKGENAAVIAELAMVVYSATLLVAVRRKVHLERWILAYIIPFFTVMMFVLMRPGATLSVFAWVFLIPILSHLLLGRRLGMAVSIFYMLVAWAVFFTKYWYEPEVMQALPIANFFFISICTLAFSHVYEVSRGRTEKRLLLLAQTDVLTELVNRAGFDDHFDREKRRAIRERLPLSFLVIDLDFFKSVNDHHGHEAGDEALIGVSDLLRERLRATDIACRLGGEEFGVMLPNTGAHDATHVAEDIRQALEARAIICQGKSISLTMSIGGAQFGRDGDTLKAVLAVADARLYQAKMLGRNRYVGQSGDEQACHSDANDLVSA